MAFGVELRPNTSTGPGPFPGQFYESTLIHVPKLAQGTGQSAPQPAFPPGVDAQIDRTMTALDLLAEAHAVLAKRLEPILRDVPSPQSTRQVSIPSQSPITNRCGILAERALSAEETVRSLLSRLDLL